MHIHIVMFIITIFMLMIVIILIIIVKIVIGSVVLEGWSDFGKGKGRQVVGPIDCIVHHY